MQTYMSWSTLFLGNVVAWWGTANIKTKVTFEFAKKLPSLGK